MSPQVPAVEAPAVAVSPGRPVVGAAGPAGPRLGGARALIGPSLTVLLSVGALTLAMRLWEWRPGTPLGLDGDNASVTTWVRTIVDYGFYADNPDLGAPFGQNLGWFATGDDVHALLIRLLGQVAPSAFTVVALYFFVGFPLAALTMYWLARTEGLSTTASVVVGVLFAVLPGHQTGFPHLFIAAYWVVPLGMWLALRLFRGLPVLLPPSGEGWHTRRGRLFVARSVGIVVVVALGGVYYTVFALILMTSALVLRLVARYRRRELYLGLAVIGSVTILTITSLLLTRARTTGDVVVGDAPVQRSAAESELFGGKIVDLLLPWSGHRSDLLAHAATAYDAATQTTYEVSAIGLVAVVGCTTAVLTILTMAMARHGWATRQQHLWSYGVLAVVAVAFYTKDGLGALFALAVTPDLRTWLRLYVVIGGFGLLAVGQLLTLWQRRRGLLTGVLTSALVVLVGLLDQTSPGAAPDYAANRAQLASISVLTSRLESELTSGCSVFQLPVVPFPGSAPSARLKDYDLELPYLTSSTLRWSYGAVHGTTRADWQALLPSEVGPLTDDLAAAQFCAVQVDTWGYESAAGLLEQLRERLGPALGTSGDGRLVAYDLRPSRASLVATSGEAAVDARGRTVLHPYRSVPEAGSGP